MATEAPHRDFYVAAAAVGPILALSIALVINAYPVLSHLGLKWSGHIPRVLRAPPPCSEVRTYARFALGLQTVAWLGFGAAAVVTIGALWSLMNNADDLSPALIIWFVLLSGATLPICSLLKGFVKNQAMRAHVDLDENAAREIVFILKASRLRSDPARSDETPETSP